MARESARHAGISATEPPVPAEDDPLPPAMLQGGGPWLFLISSTWHEVTAISPVASFRLLDFMSDSEAGWAKNSCVFQLEDPNMLDLPQGWFFCRSYQLFQLGNLEHLISFWCPFQEQLQSLVSAQEKAERLGQGERFDAALLQSLWSAWNTQAWIAWLLDETMNLTISHNTLKLTKHLNIFKLQLLKI